MGSLNSRTCESQGSIDFCQWTATIYDDSDDDYNWDCGNPIFCEAWANNKCIWYDLSISIPDCDGTSRDIVSQTQYQYCCTGDECNYEDIDISTCSQSTEYESMADEYWDCYFDQTTDAWDIMCNDDLTEVTCSDLLVIFTQRAGCLCDNYAGVYDKVGDETKVLMQDDINAQLQEFSAWNDVLGCNINLECDLSDGYKMKLCLWVCLITIIFVLDLFNFY